MDLSKYPQASLEQNLAVLKQERNTAAESSAQLEKRIRELEQRQADTATRAAELQAELNNAISAEQEQLAAHADVEGRHTRAERVRGHAARALTNFHVNGAVAKICAANRAALTDLGVAAGNDDELDEAIARGAGELIDAVDALLKARLAKASAQARELAEQLSASQADLARAGLAVSSAREQISAAGQDAAELSGDLKAARAGVRQQAATVAAADKSIGAIEVELARREAAAKKTAKANG